MGNKQAEQGNIFVQIDKEYYISGETVTGHVYLNLWESYPGNQIFLKIKGKEQSMFRQQQEKHDSTNKGQNIFYSHKIKLYTFNNEIIPAGQYSFPFQFLLSNQLPGKFFKQDLKFIGSYYEKQSRYSGIIQYKIKAECEPINSKKIKKLKYTQPLIIREPLKSLLQTLYGEQTIEAITCFCINQGQSKIKCNFQQNAYQPGDMATFNTEIDNSQCKLDISNITAKLVKNLHLTSNRGNFKSIEEDICTYQFNGVLRGQTALGQNKIVQTISIQSIGNQQIQPTTTGSLVRCEYSLLVTSVLQGFTCCKKDPFVRVPITIISPPPNNSKVQEPNNWQPKEFQHGNFYASQKIWEDGVDVDDAQYQQQQFNHNQQEYFPPEQQQPYGQQIDQPLMQGQEQKIYVNYNNQNQQPYFNYPSE